MRFDRLYLAVLGVAFFLIGLIYVFINPDFASPDELSHFIYPNYVTDFRLTKPYVKLE